MIRGSSGIALILGELTCIELIPPSAGDRLGVGQNDCFRALDSEEEGGVEWLTRRMETEHPESSPQMGLRERVRGTARVPWYYRVAFDYEEGTSGFGVWAMEYHPEFKHRMAPEVSPEPGDISRRRPAAFRGEERDSGWVWSGRDFRIEVRRASKADEYTLRKLHLSLTRAPGRKFQEPLGSSVTLRVEEGREAVLEFGGRSN